MSIEKTTVLIQSEYIPLYAKKGDAGADLCSVEEVILRPRERRLVRTGVSIALSEGFYASVVPRSGLAHKQGLSIVNSPGIIDSGYRGEIMVNLINLDNENNITINSGDRIAQIIITPYVIADFVRVTNLPKSSRDKSGFGSTGVKTIK